MKKLACLLPVLIFMVSCDSRTYEEISDRTPVPDQVRYAVEVKPIVEANCIGCHAPGGSAAYEPLTNYNEVKTNIASILDRIQRPNGDPQKMPKGGSLSPTQIAIFIKWNTDGLIEN
ncbi:c-type cytochrome [Chryseobacterium sp. SIMBA_029]|uniref:c-type cytochrome n=1 Tax=Chryseobacterium sp. SIMBA_029 TaxID=3085772 RepID=UPI00397A1D12